MKNVNGADEVTKDTFLGRMLCRMLDSKNFPRDPNNISVEIKIEGKDVDVDDFFKSLEQAIDFEIVDRAQKILQDKFSNLNEKVNRLTESLEREIRDQVAKEFPHFNLDEDY